MSDSFNGYHVWLGIPPGEQPPNHYRLLGIGIFESDLDVIDHAADRQMAHVRTFQSGRHGALSQQILNELSAARLCLLSADKKAAYDDQLRAKLSAVAKAVPVGRAVPVAVPAGQPGVLSPGKSSVLGGPGSGVISPGGSSVVSPGSSSVLSGDPAVNVPGQSGVVRKPGQSSAVSPGKSGAVSPTKSGVQRAIVKPAVAAAQPAIDESEVTPLDMAIADELASSAPSIQIRSRRRRFAYHGGNWQRPLFMGLGAAVLVTSLMVLYFFVKWLASPEFQEIYDAAFREPEAASTSHETPPHQPPAAPSLPASQP
jgi:hypothetical protein